MAKQPKQMEENIQVLERISKNKEVFDEMLASVSGLTEEIIRSFCRSDTGCEYLIGKYKSLSSMMSETIANCDQIAQETLATRGVPLRFIHAKPSDIADGIFSKVVSRDSLYIHGDAGVGKTHLSVALMRHRVETMLLSEHIVYSPESLSLKIVVGKPPLFIPVPEVLLSIRDTFHEHVRSEGTTEKFLIDRYSEKRLIVFDDLGAEKASEWSLQTLYTIVDRRYRELLPTIFTSNRPMDDLSSKIGDRIVSRIAGMCYVFHMKGPDRRLRR